MYVAFGDLLEKLQHASPSLSYHVWWAVYGVNYLQWMLESVLFISCPDSETEEAPCIMKDLTSGDCVQYVMCLITQLQIVLPGSGVLLFAFYLQNVYINQYSLTQVCPNKPLPEGATSQLIWREYFYTMSVNNIAYDTMKENPICLNIPWKKDPEMFNKWEKVCGLLVTKASRSFEATVHVNSGHLLSFVDHLTESQVCLCCGTLCQSWTFALFTSLKTLTLCADNWCVWFQQCCL